jgi:uncharacterized membrane protein YbjE (DUF340 family)
MKTIKELALRFSKKVVISAICAVVGYTIIVLIFSWFNKMVPTELTVGWFSFWGVEVIALMRLTLEDKKCNCIENQTSREGGNN